MFIARSFCTTSLAFALSACATLDSVHYAWPGPGKSTVISVDAKQRHLIMNTDKDGRFRACAEPAPDAFGAFASSLSAKGLFGATSNDAQAASAFATTAATIERTQTVNVLRDSLFRTCERFLNGHEADGNFATLAAAARDHRSMVAVLAIEQMTGVVKDPATVISGPAVQSMIGDTSKLVELLTKYQAERADAEKASVQADADVAAVDRKVSVGGKSVQACSLIERPADEAEADAAAAFDTCAPKKAAAKTAQDKFAAATANEVGVRTNLAALSGGISAATQAGSSNFGGVASGQRVSDTVMMHLASAVKEIALTAGIDDALIFCISYLNSPTGATTTRETCDQVVERAAKRDFATVARITGSSPELYEAFVRTKMDRDRGGEAGDEVNLLMRELREKILSTADVTKLANAMHAIEAAAKLPHFLSVQCTTGPKCLEAVVSNSTALVLAFQSNSSGGSKKHFQTGLIRS